MIQPPQPVVMGLMSSDFHHPWLTFRSSEDRSEGIASGDREAFAALYDDTVGFVYGTCYQLLGDADAATEATTRVYVDLWRRTADLPDRSSDMVDELACLARHHALAGLTAPLEADTPDVADERRLVALARVGGCDDNDLAELLDSTVTEVRRRLRDGLRQLTDGRDDGTSQPQKAG